MYENEITELINKNLPAHVGELLRKRLETCASLEQLVAKKDKVIEELEHQVADLKRRVREDERLQADRADLTKRIAEHDKKEQRFAIDRAVLDAMEHANAQRLQDNKEVVLAVFANARFKYEELINKTIPVPGGNGSCGYAHSCTDRRTVTTEGAGPTPPQV